MLTSGCAFDVAGTGNRNPERSGFDDSNPSATTGGTGNTSTPAESPPAAPAPTDYEALFDAPADPTTTDDVVTGLWAGKSSYGETRIKITSNMIVIAMKCGSSPAVGMDVGAVVSASQLKVLATKSVSGSYDCVIKVSPLVIPRCSDSSRYDCFQVSGTTLYFSGDSPFTSYGSVERTYTKLSD